MNSTLWVKDYCSKCKKANWVYWGKLDEMDDTEFVCDGITCWNCGHSWVFQPVFWKEENVWEIVGEDEVPVGKEPWTPKQKHFIDTGEHDGKDFVHWIRQLANLDQGKQMLEAEN